MIIAIDVGGTKISAALIDNNKIIERSKMASVIHCDLSNLSSHLFNLCQHWLDRAEQVAVACTGQVGTDWVNFLSAKQKLPLKSQLENKFKLPVTLINDAAAAAWAEYHVNQASCAKRRELNKELNAKEQNDESIDTLVYITVSTGIGGGIIQNGSLVTSNDGFCAHLGHVSVPHLHQLAIPCHCGRINCTEAIASGTAIAKQASVILNKKVSCKEVFNDYLDHPAITRLLDECTSAVTDLIANIKASTGTSQVILGGSVASTEVFFQQVKAKVAQLPEIYRVTLLKPACGADADLLGAYWYSKA
jgi:N-acylmannosamine kinase